LPNGYTFNGLPEQNVLVKVREFFLITDRNLSVVKSELYN